MRLLGPRAVARRGRALGRARHAAVSGVGRRQVGRVDGHYVAGRGPSLAAAREAVVRAQQEHLVASAVFLSF
jgi:hypothetical protein